MTNKQLNSSTKLQHQVPLHQTSSLPRVIENVQQLAAGSSNSKRHNNCHILQPQSIEKWIIHLIFVIILKPV